MVIDPTLLRVAEDAEIGMAVEDLRKRFREGRSDLTGDLLAQLGPGLDLGGGLQAEMTTTAIQFTIWNRDTGVPSQVTYDALEAHLRVRFDPSHPTMAGERVWATSPVEQKTKGIRLCPLHPAHPQRSLWDAAGFTHVVCRKSNLVTLLDEESHVSHRHPTFSKFLERKRDDDDKAVQREFMRQQTEAMLHLAGMGTGVEGPTGPVAQPDLPQDPEAGLPPIDPNPPATDRQRAMMAKARAAKDAKQRLRGMQKTSR